MIEPKTDKTVYAFTDHGNASYFGVGPWVIADEQPNPNHVRIVPTGFAYTDYVDVYKDDFHNQLVDVAEFPRF